MLPLKSFHVLCKAEFQSQFVPMCLLQLTIQISQACTFKSMLAVSGSFERIVLTSGIAWLVLSKTSPTHRIKAMMISSTVSVFSKTVSSD